MREVLDKLDECEGRLSELLIDSATDESEANSPIKMTTQEDKGEVVYLSRTRKGDMLSASGGCDSAIAARCCVACCRYAAILPSRHIFFRIRGKV